MGEGTMVVSVQFPGVSSVPYLCRFSGAAVTFFTPTTHPRDTVMIVMRAFYQNVVLYALLENRVYQLSYLGTEKLENLAACH